MLGLSVVQARGGPLAQAAGERDKPLGRDCFQTPSLSSHNTATGDPIFGQEAAVVAPFELLENSGLVLARIGGR